MHPEFRLRAWLVKNGVRLEEAFTMDEIWAQALAITFNELNGRVFNWMSKSFEDPR